MMMMMSSSNIRREVSRNSHAPDNTLWLTLRTAHRDAVPHTSENGYRTTGLCQLDADTAPGAHGEST